MIILTFFGIAFWRTPRNTGGQNYHDHALLP